MFYFAISLSILLSCYALVVLPWMLYEYSTNGHLVPFVIMLAVTGLTASIFLLIESGSLLLRGKMFIQKFSEYEFRTTFCLGFGSAMLFLAMSAFTGNALLILAKTKPIYDEDISDVAGLDGDIRITRDQYGAPTIKAQTLRDALFGQGLIHAQDRISQLVLERAASRGKVSEVVGKSGLSHDIMARTYNFNATAYAMCDGLSSKHRSLMQSYVNGINTHLQNNPVYPPDMYLYGKRLLVPDKIEEWTIYDLCCSMVQYQTQLSSNCDTELRRWSAFWDADASDPYDVVETLYPGQKHYRDDEGKPFATILSDSDLRGPYCPANVHVDANKQKLHEDESFATEKEVYQDLLQDSRFKSYQSRFVKPGSAFNSYASSSNVDEFELFQEGGLRGSNAWVVSPAEQKSPLLANDPHLDMYLPGPWHFSTLIIEKTGQHFSGATHVGLPGISIGKSQHVAWGMTLAMTDLCDLYIIFPDKLRPGTHYMYKGVSMPFLNRAEVIKVKNAPEIRINVRETHYGPMLDNYKNEKYHSLAVWNAASQAEHASHTLESFLNFVSDIQTVAELRDKVLHGIAAPALSIVMADSSGAIGYGITGMHPERSKGHTGRYPIPGDGRFDHKLIIPMRELPWKVVPEQKMKSVFIAAGNNKIYPQSYKFFLGYDYLSNHRSMRIGQLLEESQEHTVSSMQELQLDSLSNVWVQTFRPWLQQEKALLRYIPKLNEMVEEWDGSITREDTFSPILWEYMEILTAKFRKMHKVKPSRQVDPLVAYYISIDKANSGLVRDAWIDAFRKKVGSWGDDWGFMSLPHFFLANTPLRFVGNLFPVKQGGDYSSVNMLAGRKSSRPNTRHFGPSIRLIIETSSRLLYAIPGGFSENPFSPFYANLVELWSNGEYTETVACNKTESSRTRQIVRRRTPITEKG